MNTEKKIISKLWVLSIVVIVSVILNTFWTYFVLMQVEYKKVWGKNNYEILQKMQLQQIQQFVEQYKKNPNGNAPQANTDINNWNNTKPAPVAQLTKEQIADLKKDTFVKWIENAKVSIIEYSDLECPFCKKLFESKAIQNVLSANKDTLNYSFKHFPLEFHKNAQKEAEALECAGELGGKEAFFSMKDAIFTKTRANGEWFALADLAPLAKELKLDDKNFQSCLDSWKYTDRVKNDGSNGNTLFGIDGTPWTVILNNTTGKFEVISWAQSQSAFESALKKVSE